MKTFILILRGLPATVTRGWSWRRWLMRCPIAWRYWPSSTRSCQENGKAIFDQLFPQNRDEIQINAHEKGQGWLVPPPPAERLHVTDEGISPPDQWTHEFPSLGGFFGNQPANRRLAESTSRHLYGGRPLNLRGLVQLKRGAYDRAVADYSGPSPRTKRTPTRCNGRGVAKLRSGATTGGNADIAAA
jgi:hypothetical protein